MGVIPSEPKFQEWLEILAREILLRLIWRLDFRQY